jgi:hypothetical protein
VSPEVATLAAQLHRLATSTDPDADRCADALAALVEPLAPTPGQLVAWLEAHGWACASSPDGWQTMRRRLIHLDVPQLEHAPDYARCVGHLLDDVAAVEHSRRSREVIDLWAWMQARDPSASTPTPP